VVTHHAGLFGYAAKMHQVHEWPWEVVVDHVGLCRQFTKLLEHTVGEAGGRQLKVHSGLMDLMFTDLDYTGCRVVTQGQDCAVDTMSRSALAQLKNDLFDTAHGVRQVGFVKVQYAHISLQ
jgi:hypothetical protein